MNTKIDLGLTVLPGAVKRFSGFLDPERLVRLHPHWHLEGLALEGERWVAQLKDHATDRCFTLSFTLTFPEDHAFLIDCHKGPVQHVHVFVEDQRLHLSYLPHGDQLSPEEEQDLTLWLQSIRQYLRLYCKTTAYTRFFRLLMNKAILKMNPSQRKICLMLYRFTLLEIVVILLVVIGYFFFGRS